MVENKKEFNAEELKQEDMDKINGGRFGSKLSEEEKKEREEIARKRAEEREKNAGGATGSW